MSILAEKKTNNKTNAHPLSNTKYVPEVSLRVHDECQPLKHHGRLETHTRNQIATCHLAEATFHQVHKPCQSSQGRSDDGTNHCCLEKLTKGGFKKGILVLDTFYMLRSRVAKEADVARGERVERRLWIRCTILHRVVKEFTGQRSIDRTENGGGAY